MTSSPGALLEIGALRASPACRALGATQVSEASRAPPDRAARRETRATKASAVFLVSWETEDRMVSMEDSVNLVPSDSRVCVVTTVCRDSPGPMGFQEGEERLAYQVGSEA